MKIIIVSDNHTRPNICQEIVDKYSHEETIFLHCGDSEFAYNNLELQSFIKVSGNCDYDRLFPDIEVISTPLGKILLTHGHYYHVGFSRNLLAREAKQYQANFAIYGHTHIPRCEVIEDIVCINPGSIAQSRSPQFPNCYAILQKKSNQYNVIYFDEYHQELMTIEI